MKQDITQDIRKAAYSLGADLVGMVDLKLLDEIVTLPGDLFSGYRSAVSVAVSLPAAVFETVTDRPSLIYASFYQTANRILDEITFGLAKHIQRMGFSALPIPASQVVDRERWLGAVSHKAVAVMAGLGWQGKNLLLITGRYGSRVRLATLLTDAGLEYDKPVENRCGNCQNCMDACPVGAIKGVNTTIHYNDRNEAMHFDRCAEKLAQEFAKMPGIDTPICGICIKACPFGLRRR